MPHYVWNFSITLGETLNLFLLLGTLIYLSHYVADTKKIARANAELVRLSAEVAEATAEASEAGITPCVDLARKADTSIRGAASAGDEELRFREDPTAGSVRSILDISDGGLSLVNVGTGPALRVSIKLPGRGDIPPVWREVASIPAGGRQKLHQGLLHTADRRVARIEIRYVSLSHTQYVSTLEIIDGQFVKNFNRGRVTLIGGREPTVRRPLFDTDEREGLSQE